MGGNVTLSKEFSNLWGCGVHLSDSSATGFGDKFNGQKNGSALDGREDILVGVT